MLSGPRPEPHGAMGCHHLVVLLGMVLTLSWGATLQAAGPQTSQQPNAARAVAAPPPQQALLDRYCLTCHNERLKTANLSLDQANVEQVGHDAELWEKVVGKLRSRTMPPAGRPRPDDATYDELATWLETGLDQAAAANPNAGQPGNHRLNRAEYANAIRDLLGVEIDVRSQLPADDVGYGFDNMADVLSVTPGLLERYLLVAQKVSRLALGDPTVRPEITSYKPPTLFRQEDRTGEDQTFGTRGGIAVRHQFPVDGEYVFGVSLQRVVEGPIRGVSERNILQLRLDGALLEQFTVFCDPTSVDQSGSGSQLECAVNADADLEVRMPVTAGSHVVAAAFQKNPWLKEGLVPDREAIGFYEYFNGRDVQVSIETLDVGGPYTVAGPGESASRSRILVCRPEGSGAEDEEACATRILSTLARRAFRRPVTDDKVQTLLGFYRLGRPDGFDAGIQVALERILIDPEFLFRIERRPAGVASGALHPLSDIDLASRLSFFLWSSIPDDELLNLAERGQLKNRAVLNQQVGRMLADERSQALVENFGGQWLFLRNLREVAPDPKEYPDFDDNLREAMQRETELFLAEQIRGDHPLADLLSADYTFINQRLAEHYGIPKVYGSHFRRVKYPDDRRAGLLGQAGILVSTNTYPNRTSPVKRGVWLLSNILGAPPPSPPPDVPPFPEEPAGKVLTVRERMEQHRENPVCAACHDSIDPLGFALENFDATGQWRDRDRDAGMPIDAAGQLPDGSTFDGPVELRELLLDRREEVIATMTKKLFTYALGRGFEHYDMPAMRQVLRDAEPTDYRWSSIILGIVNSMPFQMRGAES